ncbi:SDR family NAD(P)-dependent oxidoreductase [Alicyclobacillus dauci]|uniref:SDR family oxidoreductase n=1 Tax=Alicyclobacillus dauci TaxID=1475485 RepID=A0ABY6YZY5_9BACL|nr:SDR family oxidoreductase [Alicyclobacillus dauci]WAH36203.1 SDR family oxidoreductase [Alicyclobacillus dauci]
MKFKDQVVIVTGSGRGIGRAAVIGFAKEGAQVVVNDVDEEEAWNTAQEIREMGGKAVAYVGSVSSRSSAQELVDVAVKEFGTVNVLVNNAAVTRPAMIHKMTEEQWDTVIDVGLKGVFNCIQAVSPVFIDRGKQNPDGLSNGKVINVTSVAGLTGTVGQINYGAMKSGVVGITMSTAREWGRYRIQSNAVAFGVVETRMTETIREDKFADTYKSKITLGRFATVDDVVPGVLFLGSNDANYITGHVLNVSGGYYIGF